MTHAATQVDQQAGNQDDTLSRHPAFEFIRRQHIQALNLDVEEYRHRKTGASHYHLAADNPENVFLVALRTVPTDSTGVAHILEHTALCGSERFPVRDPFFMMIRRSLNTFMNAFTSSDWTAYPFASQNRKDFFNLLDVYLDAVFFSRLDQLDFAQEGHRVEFETVNDPDTPLVYKGVVFNEMKGAMSSPVTTLWQTLTEKLFPTTTYHYNSGGDPEHIPDLSYEELKAFYDVHYHPTNAVFMTYGDIPAHEHHRIFEDRALSRFERLDRQIRVNNEQRFDKPVTVESHYALDETDAQGDKTHIVIGWLLGNNTDPYELMKAHLLSSVLLDNGASPLRYALETTELGSAPSPLCGLEDSNHEMSFVCGLEGSSETNADAVETLVMDVLNNVVTRGIDQQQVDAVLHQLELGQREVGGDGYPYGLQLILEGLPAAVHHGDPVALMDIEPVLARLHDDIKNPQFIPEMVRELLLNNRHRVRLCMSPDTLLAEKKSLAEKLRLEQIKSALKNDEKKRIVDLAHALQQRQQMEDDPSILPKVGIEDIPEHIHSVQFNRSGNTVPVNFSAQGTNGLVYQQWIADLPELPETLLPLMPVYLRCLTEVGVGDRDYLQTQVWQDTVSGGISASTNIRGQLDRADRLRADFIFSGKALSRNHAALTELMRETLEAPRFDEQQRIREIINQSRARAEQSVTGNGHGLAMSAACQNMSPGAQLAHRLRGLQGIRSIKKLDDDLGDSNKLSELCTSLSGLHQTITDQTGQMLLIAEAQYQDEYIATLTKQWTAKTGRKIDSSFNCQAGNGAVRQMWLTSTQVNFCARAYVTVPAGHDDSAALAVLGGFLRNGYLHRAIREQGGAYGGGAGQDSDNACFRFFSYRDPRLAETLEDFDHSVDWLLGKDHEWRLVEEAILGVISNIDKPGSPAGDAKRTFHNALHGRTHDQREAFRQKIIGVTLKDLQRVGEKYLRPECASTAVITHKGNLPQAQPMGLEPMEL
ncbi:MAG: insulinase family protein [Gammaproteobacteria bacterium]|nr:insulinase family protein [Gammaproteobacteria bacterium]